ncbi:MAG TPA: DnaJ domain-containing protein, partial [Pseudonocardia sp.]
MDLPLDYYTVLGVARDADQDEIQRAYRRLARRYHPDLNKDPEAEQRFKQLGEAYAVLSEPTRRARYDHGSGPWRHGPGEYTSTGRPFSTAGSGQRVYVRTGGFDGGEFGNTRFSTGGDFSEFADLFGGLFSGGRPAGSRRTGPVPGTDTQLEIELSVEDAYTGGRRVLTVDTLAGPRRYQVTIPPGAVDGQRIRVADHGGGGPRRELNLVVRVAPHPRYRVHGRDITVEVPVTPWAAALGGQLSVPTPNGLATVDLPPGSSSG